MLAVRAAQERMSPLRVHNLQNMTLAQTLPVLRKAYPEITEINVNHNQQVTLQGIDADGNDINAYINPQTAQIIGKTQKQPEWVQWATALHRSLFLHETGRLVVGITSFCLLLISLSGLLLFCQRQQTWKRFFAKIPKDGWAQYYHVAAGRLLLIPMLIISCTGAYLSAERFEILGKQKIKHNIEPPTHTLSKPLDLANFQDFKTINWAQVQSIEFPFAQDPEEYFTLKLQDREIIIDQFTGKTVSQIFYNQTTIWENISLDLHTGRSNLIWAIILGITSLNMLFFVYSGFMMTYRRLRTRVNNPYTAAEAEYILLVGSENGSTRIFANAIHKQLLQAGLHAHLTDLNQYTTFPKAKQLLIFAATHGLGDAPSNARKFSALVKEIPQNQTINFSVIGFGSKAYPDFCAYAKDIETLLLKQTWAKSLLPLYTVNDKSAQDFTTWVKALNATTQLTLAENQNVYFHKPKHLRTLRVISKTLITEQEQTFILTLRVPFATKFKSGDLLAIYPQQHERLYSVAKIGRNIQLTIKLHPSGLGSGFLHSLEVGDKFQARVVRNVAFHWPKNASAVIMIANGTGIAPFWGMIDQNKKQTKAYLYAGFRHNTPLIVQYQQNATTQQNANKLKQYQLAFSRQTPKQYVMDLLKKDADLLVNLLAHEAVIMICGSWAMQRDVEATLNEILAQYNAPDITYYKNNGQILADCY